MFLKLNSICQTIRVIDGIKEIAKREERSPESLSEDPTVYSRFGGLKWINVLSDISSRDIHSTFQEITKEVKDLGKTLDEIQETSIKELGKLLQKVFEDNVPDTKSLFTTKEYERITRYLLRNHRRLFLNFCNRLNSTDITKELIAEVNENTLQNGMKKSDLERSLEISIEDNQDLIRSLLREIDPTLNENVTCTIMEVNGKPRHITTNNLTGEISVGKIVSNKPDSKSKVLVMETVRNLYHLLPTYNAAEDTAVIEKPFNEADREKNIKRVIRLASLEIKKGNLMNAQLSLEAAIKNGLSGKNIKALLNHVKDKRENVEIPGKVLTVRYAKPIPIGNNDLWIARGGDLNKISSKKTFKDNSFYLVGSSISYETVELPNSKEVLIAGACKDFNNRIIYNSGLRVTCSGDEIKVNLSNMSFESATNFRLVSAHKVLAGSPETGNPGLIREHHDLHNYNARAFKRLEESIEKLNENLSGEQLQHFIAEVLEGQNPLLLNLDMHGEADKAITEWNISVAKRLRSKVFDSCIRDRAGFGTSVRKLMKREDFLKIVNETDLNNSSNQMVIKEIVRWNLEFHKAQQERECLFSFMDSTESYLRSNRSGITGAEDEINIRLQKIMEQYMWREAPELRFKIDSFSKEKHPVTVKEESGIKEVIITPKLAYTIVKGKTHFFDTKYLEALDTVMCYL